MQFFVISMKECLLEYRDYDISTIVNDFIEVHTLGDIDVHENIVGNNTDGKRTTFDVLFFRKTS